MCGFMVLERYLKRNGITQQEFAHRLGCSQSLVSQWISGAVALSGRWAVKIERVTEGGLLRQDLLPELFRGMEHTN